MAEAPGRRRRSPASPNAFSRKPCEATPAPLSAHGLRNYRTRRDQLIPGLARDILVPEEGVDDEAGLGKIVAFHPFSQFANSVRDCIYWSPIVRACFCGGKEDIEGLHVIYLSGCGNCSGPWFPIAIPRARQKEVNSSQLASYHVARQSDARLGDFGVVVALQCVGQGAKFVNMAYDFAISELIGSHTSNVRFGELIAR